MKISRMHVLVCLVLLVVMLFAGYVRALGYFNLDGSTKYEWLRNIDSYYFTKYTDLVFRGQSWDNTILAPVGGWYISGSFVYPTVAAIGYKIVQLTSNMLLDYYMAWLSPIIAVLCAIPAYFIGKVLWNKKAGILFAFFSIMSAQFVSRSLGGDPDSDAIAMLMFLLSVLAVILIIKRHDVKILSKRNVFLGLFAGIIFGIFIYTWSGFWFPFAMMMAFIAIKFVSDTMYKRSIKASLLAVLPLLFCLLVAWFVFWVIATPVYGVSSVLLPVQSPMLGMVFKESIGVAGVGSFFPNVAVSIAELQAGGDIRGVLLASGGVDIISWMGLEPLWLFMLFSPAVVSVLWLLYMAYRKYDNDTLLFVGVWLIIFIVASVMAVRFGMFLGQLFGLCAAMMFSELLDKAWKGKNEDSFKKV
jgi:asparagine N-glycosylation enzyme membrane subunit Stt3